jgi:hypothetical protein
MLRGEVREGAYRDDREGRYYIAQHDGVVWVERDENTPGRQSSGAPASGAPSLEAS